ncbi:MAG: serine/threonine protein kinase [Armatimonadetes bacterium]|nr:serine/threonine protein kinase [Armatimonadota bacterium]
MLGERRPVGDLLHGRYRVDRELGSGGMGAVFLATHVELDQPVAIKEIGLDLFEPSARDSVMRQVYSEARLLSQLRHPRLPRVHDFFNTRNHFYLVMEFVEGITLDDHLLSVGPASEMQTLGWAAELCDVLAYLHGLDPPVIYRDLKPSNVMLEPDGHLKLIDFGIAKLLDPVTGEGTLTLARGAGTHGFAPPEQYGSGTDARADVYALGATLYCVLTGEFPPESGARVSGAKRLQPVKAKRPDVSEPVARAIETMMALKVSERPQGIGAAASALGIARPNIAAAPTTRVRSPLAAPTASGSRWPLAFAIAVAGALLALVIALLKLQF